MSSDEGDGRASINQAADPCPRGAVPYDHDDFEESNGDGDEEYVDEVIGSNSNEDSDIDSTRADSVVATGMQSLDDVQGFLAAMRVASLPKEVCDNPTFSRVC